MYKFYWNICFDYKTTTTRVLLKYRVPYKYMFQGSSTKIHNSSKKGREKVYVSRPNPVMISRGTTVAALPLSSLPFNSEKESWLLNWIPKKPCSKKSMKALFNLSTYFIVKWSATKSVLLIWYWLDTSTKTCERKQD